MFPGGIHLVPESTRLSGSLLDRCRRIVPDAGYPGRQEFSRTASESFQQRIYSTDFIARTDAFAPIRLLDKFEHLTFQAAALPEEHVAAAPNLKILDNEPGPWQRCSKCTEK